MVPRGWDIGPTSPMDPSPWPGWNAGSHGHLYEGRPYTYIHAYIISWPRWFLTSCFWMIFSLHRIIWFVSCPFRPKIVQIWNVNKIWMNAILYLKSASKNSLQLKVCLKFHLNITWMFFASSCWPTRDHIGRSTGIPTQLWHLPQVVPRVALYHRFRAPPAYTAQLLALHQHRASNQYRTANQI